MMHGVSVGQFHHSVERRGLHAFNFTLAESLPCPWSLTPVKRWWQRRSCQHFDHSQDRDQTWTNQSERLYWSCQAWIDGLLRRKLTCNTYNKLSQFSDINWYVMHTPAVRLSLPSSLDSRAFQRRNGGRGAAAILFSDKRRKKTTWVFFSWPLPPKWVQPQSQCQKLFTSCPT